MWTSRSCLGDLIDAKDWQALGMQWLSSGVKGKADLCAKGLFWSHDHTMGNIQCCVLPSPHGGHMAKHEPYDRTGLANESFELPHISDREGIQTPNCLFKLIRLQRSLCYRHENWITHGSLSLISPQIFQITRGHYFYVDLCLIQVSKYDITLHDCGKNRQNARSQRYHMKTFLNPCLVNFFQP